MWQVLKEISIHKTIANIVGGNMKIIEDYAKDYAKNYATEKINEEKEEIIINLKNEGYGIKDIARIVRVNIDIVEKTLSK